MFGDGPNGDVDDDCGDFIYGCESEEEKNARVAGAQTFRDNAPVLGIYEMLPATDYAWCPAGREVEAEDCWAAALELSEVVNTDLEPREIYDSRYISVQEPCGRQTNKNNYAQYTTNCDNTHVMDPVEGVNLVCKKVRFLFIFFISCLLLDHYFQNMCFNKITFSFFIYCIC